MFCPFLAAHGLSAILLAQDHQKSLVWLEYEQAREMNPEPS
jgi:hypothetical protein